MAEIDRRLSPDLKGQASLTFAQVIIETKDNYPDPRYRHTIYGQTPYYKDGGINPHPYEFASPNADGIGTKPELSERLLTESIRLGKGNPSSFEDRAFDTFAMVDGDSARFGLFMVGITQVIDMNKEDKDVVAALARGVKKACDEGNFALLNGETAGLGYRNSGYGDTRINWNAVGLSIRNPNKLIRGDKLKPGQPIVAVRELSVRSNGFTDARNILEAGYLLSLGYSSKEDLINHWAKQKGYEEEPGVFLNNLRELFGHDPLEQILRPWHEHYPQVTRELLVPSRLYGPLMYQIQGGIDGERRVKMVAAAHITGGGVPEKAQRMVEEKGLGVAVDAVFPDPAGVQALLQIYSSFPADVKKRVNMNDERASKTWNRGIGFLVVVEDKQEAERFVEISERNNYEAAVVGEVLDKPEIHFRGHTWKYEPNAT